MHIVLIIFGLLFLLFGGGCTLIMMTVMVTDSANFWGNLQDILPIWIPLGLLPLVVGWLLLRWGIKSRRAKQAASRDK